MILSLIAKPGNLSADMLSKLGARNWTWLSETEAAEALIDALPEAFEDLRVEWGAHGVDVNALPEENRRKRILIADMDSTMIEQECIDEMAAHAGIGAQVAEITARAMNGELDFEEAIDARVALIEGLAEADLSRVFEERISFMPGGATLLATMKANRAYAALVSGGFTYFTGRVADALGFDENRANTLLMEDGKLTGKVAKPVLGQDAKVQALEEIAARLGLSEGDAIAVGDGANDLGMLSRAGLGVALHAKPTVQAKCDIRINHGDLTALLYLQGYRKADFATLSSF